MFKKGQSGNPNGRGKGVPTKATQDFKEAVNNLLNFGAPQMIEWLDRVAKEDPAKALDVVGRLAEFAFPKLARTEHSGIDGEPLINKIEIVAAKFEDGDSAD